MYIASLEKAGALVLVAGGERLGCAFVCGTGFA